MRHTISTKLPNSVLFSAICFLMLCPLAVINAQPVSGQRATPTVNSPKFKAELDTSQTMLQKCAQVQPDASYLIPRSEQFGGRTEASGSGAYAYKPAGNCPYWVVDFHMNRFSNTYINPTSGETERDEVIFSGNAFDLPSSGSSVDNGGKTPIVEEDCKRLEVDVFIYRKDPNENTFKFLKGDKMRFSWDSTSKRCNQQGLWATYAEEAPLSNMLKIRIAVRVKLRGSWQQAAGYANPGAPS